MKKHRSYAPCRECGTPLDEVPFAKCTTHADHADVKSALAEAAAEGLWASMSWSERYHEDPHRAFVELAEKMEGSQ